MKSMIKLIVIILICFILTSCSNTVPTTANNNPLPQVTPVEEASEPSFTPTPLITEKTLTDNQMAHNSYEDAIRYGELFSKRVYIEQYSFYDIDDDGVDELITFPLYGAYMYYIYSFNDDKANKMSINEDADIMTIYPAKGVISFTSTGRVDSYIDAYYQITNGKAYQVATKDTRVYNDESANYSKYYVNDNETTEAEFKEFIKALCTGKQVRPEDLQWRQWVGPEGLHPSYVHQLNETETHYFRFDSNALNSISFRFDVSQDRSKLKSMKITLCDLDLKPISKTDSFGPFEQMDYQCTISEEDGYYLKVVTEFEKSSNCHSLYYNVFISTTKNDG